MLSLDVKKLMSEILDATNRLKPHVQQRVTMLRTFAGPHYRGDTEQAATPDNYPYVYKTFVRPQILFGVPSVSVRASLEVTDAPIAEGIMAGTNAWAQDDHVADVFDEATDDTFFGFGATKICLAKEPGDSFYGDRDNGLVIEHIPPGDLIIDARAKRVSDVRLVGHTFERDLDDVQADEKYDPAETAKLAQQDTMEEQNRGDAFPSKTEAERKRVKLYEIYVYEHNLILTIAAKGDSDGVILRQETYNGPPHRLGPYDLWGLEKVSGELIGISPIQALWDEFCEVNEHGRAAANSAETHKSIGVYNNSNKADANSVQKAQPGELVGVQDVNSVKNFEIGGATEWQVNWIQFLRQKLDRNLGMGDAQRGVAGDQTATGEQIAANNTDIRIDSMRNNVSKTVKSIFWKVGWYLHNESSIAPIPVTVRDPMTGMPQEATFMSGEWDGGFWKNQYVPPQMDVPDFNEMRFDVDVRSMVKTDDAIEQKRAQDELLLAQNLHAMGFPVNWRGVLDRYGSAFNVRNYSQIILLDQGGMIVPPSPTAPAPGESSRMLGTAMRKQLPGPQQSPVTYPGMMANAQGGIA